MYCPRLYLPFILGLGLIFGVCQPQASSVSVEQAEKIFAFEVYPMLEAKCFACHGEGPEELKGELDLRSLQGMVKGGESGQPALVPGHPDQSPIYLAATREDPDFLMPPKDNDKLSESQLSYLRQWIAGQAPWPDETRRLALLEAGDWDYGGTLTVKTSTARSASWAQRRYLPEDLWAFLPLTQPKVPEPSLAGKAHPIDAFIEAGLKEAGLEPAPPADKRTLIRRASFDLTGLPPDPAAVAAFLADDRPDAFERLIDTLLDSPQYGEQWARHWLDVVRYADSDGFSNDYARPNAWRYRDYVIRAFNEDKPYPQFVQDQIAGDEIDPEDPEMLVATGFLRMGPWEHTSMSVEAETRQYFLDDVTNAVGETFLSLPLRCARCHDHKFDPIPTKDFYRIQAVFATTQFAERPAPFIPEENLNRMDSERERIQNWLDSLQIAQQALQKKEEDAARAWYREQGRRYLPKGERMKQPEGQRPPRYHGLTFQDLGYRKVLNKHRQLLNQEKNRFEPLAFSVYSGPFRSVHSARPMRLPPALEGPAESTFILTGGSVYAPSEPVSPGVLSALAPLAPERYAFSDTLMPRTMDRRRLAFSHWLTHPHNPLTYRSIVNRVWQYHFGKGLAENSNNFGATGKKPTHPALLDWLAGRFIQSGGSLKTLHKLIMTSEAYQRASQHPVHERLKTRDPDNRLLAVFSPRRLAAEEMRDAMLWVSGELNLEMGGIPVRPEINLEVALQPRHTMGSVAPAYQPSPRPEDRNRRSIYAERLRNLPDPMQEVFNRPGPDLSCERRVASTVSTQALTLLNSQQTQDRAVAFAHFLGQTHPRLQDQVQTAIERTWNRQPSKEELAQSIAFVEKMTRYHQENKIQAWTYPTAVTRTMFEEMTGEPFSYTERLLTYENYTPDLKAWEVSPQVRALADLALVLFNSNEFVYVY